MTEKNQIDKQTRTHSSYSFSSFRGIFVCYRVEYLGKVNLVNPLCRTADARLVSFNSLVSSTNFFIFLNQHLPSIFLLLLKKRFQRSTRREAERKVVSLSLRAACRFELTKIKSQSYLLPAASFCFAMSTLDYGREIFIPALANYAQLYHFRTLGLFSDADALECSAILRASSEADFRRVWESIRQLPLSAMVKTRQTLTNRLHSSLKVPLDPSLWRFVAYGLHNY